MHVFNSILQQDEASVRVTKDFCSSAPGAVSRISRMFTQTSEEKSNVIIGSSSGQWPRLSLVERIFITNGRKENDWTLIKDQVS